MVRKNALVLVGMGTMLLASGTARAQDTAAPAGPNSGVMTMAGSFDVVNPYMFRGIRQNQEGVAMWPTLDVGIKAKRVGFNVGTWNSLHTGDGLSWYEGDFYATVGFDLGASTAFSATYTAYNSPHGSFTTVNEIAFKLAVDDSNALGSKALSPYIFIAQEFDVEPGMNQADGGEGAGTYLELGVAPGVTGSKASIAFPIKLGMSLKDYYELDGEDNKFGFFSVAGVVTIPLGGMTSAGSWSLRGGVEYQALGTTTKFYNNDDSNRIIGSFGFAFSY
jgi:hypothetical protein